MKDIYQQMTDLIVSGVDEAGEWQPCWRGGNGGLPINASTGKRYRGVNILSCWVTAMCRGYSNQRWGTYRQWEALGAQVRRGEKGTPIVFYKILVDKEDKERPMARGSYVFNADQVEGAPEIEADSAPELDQTQRIARLEHWLACRRHAFTLTHSEEQQAYYRPGTDSVNMPEFARFTDAEHYYSVLFHELTHWAGGKPRLNRSYNYANTQDRAREELVAELGAAFLCAEHRIETVTRDDHTSYIASWLKALKDDKRCIVTAASQASAAVDLLESLAVEQKLAA